MALEIARKFVLPLFLVILGSSFFSTTSLASMVFYQRGANVSPPTAPHRFGYSAPGHNKRGNNTGRPCIRHGRALCLTKPKPILVYTRHPNGKPVVKVHPYLRKLKKPKTYRYR